MDRSDTPDVVALMWRLIALARFALLAYAFAVVALAWDHYRPPAAGLVVLGVLLVWSVISTWWYAVSDRAAWWVPSVDTAIAVAALVAGRFVQDDHLLAQGATIPGFWVISPVLAWAVRSGWKGGAFAACTVAVADLASRVDIDSENVSNVFLMLLAGSLVGYSTQTLEHTATIREQLADREARAAERERFARAVHDRTLQVLAYIQRRGHEIGGDAVELARQAGDQEVELRQLLLSHGDVPTEGGTDDLGRLLAGLGTARVSVARPLEPVVVDQGVADETVAAVRAALDNVDRHAPGSRAYILLESHADEVVVSVRDDGPGIPEGRLEEAAAAGRMGVSRSIVGRIGSLGGTAEMTSAPGEGTEWELRIPRDGQRAAGRVRP